MPEYTEVLACYLTILWWWLAVKDTSTLQLVAIWGDGTKQESTTGIVDASGLVCLLDYNSKIKRGPTTAQGYVWPHLTKEKPLESLEGLVLQDVCRTPRTVILNFGTMSLQIQLLTHTLVQLYTRVQWDTEITQVACINNERGFRVGIALDFGDYVLAFLTADMLFTPNWFITGEPYPVQHLDVYNDFSAWLSAVAGIVKAIHKHGWHKHQQLATTAIRETHGHIFGGIGVYTITEVFFMAGLSPFLTEGELFQSPSRVARLCAAVWTFADRAHKQLPALLKPCFVGFVLAPTDQHRLLFSLWLHVHAKQHVYMSVRMKVLHKAYETRLLDLVQNLGWDRSRIQRNPKSAQLFDVFEPTYLQPAFQVQPDLIPLVWGESFLEPPKTNALAVLYHRNLWWKSGGKSHLNSSQPLALLSSKDMRGARIETSLYLCPDVKTQKAIWSITSPLPLPQGLDTHFQLASPKVRNARTFVEIVQSRAVAVGPLEYCALGHRVTRAGPEGKGNWQLVVCKQSPTLESHFREREKATSQMKKDGRNKAGASHAACSKAHSRGGWVKKSQPTSRKGKAVEVDADDHMPRYASQNSQHPVKRVRLSIDAKLAMGMQV
ncbi:hypothetical protein C8Q76DRAFT_732904 [Earliella scabrosa]|nr:hypothetical protein C8Q76DRAFT_753206 [Earliella scabrosa]KAI0713954.1 hypothetical protein C8Q76DRAFT_732904 [Earliella scabrosa]